VTYRLETDVETITATLARSLTGQLEAAIRAKLMAEAEAIVATAAKEIASNIQSKVVSWRDSRGMDGVQMTLVLDGVATAVAAARGGEK